MGLTVGQGDVALGYFGNVDAAGHGAMMGGQARSVKRTDNPGEMFRG